MPYIPKRFSEEEQYLFWEKSPNDMEEKDLEQLIEAAKEGKKIVINGFLPKEKLLATRKGLKGCQGPSQFTDLAIPDNKWTEQHGELNGLCLMVLNYLQEHPGIARKIEITNSSIKSFK